MASVLKNVPVHDAARFSWGHHIGETSVRRLKARGNIIFKRVFAGGSATVGFWVKDKKTKNLRLFILTETRTSRVSNFRNLNIKWKAPRALYKHEVDQWVFHQYIDGKIQRNQVIVRNT